jgi:hypothetical protein
MAEESLISPQKRAEHLLFMADAVQRSIKSRRNIVSDMNKEKDSIVDDFEASTQFDITSELSLAQEHSTASLAASHQSSDTTKQQNASSKGKSEKKSKTKTIADLRQQLHDCKSALVEIKENASLKYLKLEMEREELNESYVKLKELKNQADHENEVLKRKLSSAVGSDRVEWIVELESNQEKLQKELDQMTLQRDDAMKELEDIKSLCCASCLDKMRQTSKVPVNAPASLPQSLWSFFQLDEEAKATTEAASTIATIYGSDHQQLPFKMFIEQRDTEPTKKISHFEEPDYVDKPSSAPSNANDDLEADLEAIEKKMKDDIENMSREWKQPSKKLVNNRKVRRDMIRSNKRNAFAKSKSTRETLDSFFSITQSIRNLGAEEMDEEKSFYSIQRSVSASSSPDKESLKERESDSGDDTRNGLLVLSEESPTSIPPRSANNLGPDSTSDSLQREFGQDVDAVEIQEDQSTNEESQTIATSTQSLPGDRRGLMSKGFSLRDSFRSLSQEVEDDGGSSKALDRRLENLRAKSLREDFSNDLGRKRTNKSRPKSTLRSSSEIISDRKAVRWEDPSKKEDEAKLRVSKDVEAWAAADLAPIMSL